MQIIKIMVKIHFLAFFIILTFSGCQTNSDKKNTNNESLKNKAIAGDILKIKDLSKLTHKANNRISTITFLFEETPGQNTEVRFLYENNLLESVASKFIDSGNTDIMKYQYHESNVPSSGTLEYNYNDDVIDSFSFSDLADGVYLNYGTEYEKKLVYNNQGFHLLSWGWWNFNRILPVYKSNLISTDGKTFTYAIFFRNNIRNGQIIHSEIDSFISQYNKDKQFQINIEDNRIRTIEYRDIKNTFIYDESNNLKELRSFTSNTLWLTIKYGWEPGHGNLELLVL